MKPLQSRSPFQRRHDFSNPSSVEKSYIENNKISEFIKVTSTNNEHKKQKTLHQQQLQNQQFQQLSEQFQQGMGPNKEKTHQNLRQNGNNFYKKQLETDQDLTNQSQASTISPQRQQIATKLQNYQFEKQKSPCITPYHIAKQQQQQLQQQQSQYQDKQQIYPQQYSQQQQQQQQDQEYFEDGYKTKTSVNHFQNFHSPSAIQNCPSQYSIHTNKNLNNISYTYNKPNERQQHPLQKSQSLHDLQSQILIDNLKNNDEFQSKLENMQLQLQSYQKQNEEIMNSPIHYSNFKNNNNNFSTAKRAKSSDIKLKKSPFNFQEQLEKVHLSNAKKQNINNNKGQISNREKLPVDKNFPYASPTQLTKKTVFQTPDINSESSIQKSSIVKQQVEISSEKKPIMTENNEKQQKKFKKLPENLQEQFQSIKKIDSSQKKYSRFAQLSPSFRMSPGQFLVSEQSCSDEMKNYEQILDLDVDIQSQIETQFSEISQKTENLLNQFDLSVELSQKIEQKQQELHKLMLGAQMNKISRKNHKSYHLRHVFYAPNLDAICWRDPKSKFPSDNQIIYLKDISQITAKPTQKLPEKLQETNYFQIISQAPKEQKLELIAQNPETKNLFIKTINTLIQNRKSNKVHSSFMNFQKSPDMDVLQKQYFTDIEKIKLEISQAKNMFKSNLQILKKTFFNITQTVLQNQKQKTKKKVNQAQDHCLKQFQTYKNQKTFQQQLELQSQKAINEQLEKSNQILQQQQQNSHQNSQFLPQQQQQQNEGVSNDLNGHIIQENQQLMANFQNLQNEYNNLKVNVQSNEQYVIKSFQEIEYIIMDFFKNTSPDSKYFQKLQKYQEEKEKNNATFEQQIFQLKQNVMKIIEGYRELEFSLKSNSNTSKHMNMFSEEAKRKYEEINSKYQVLLSDFNKVLNEKTNLLVELEKKKEAIQVCNDQNKKLKDKNGEILQKFETFYVEMEQKEQKFIQVIEGLEEIKKELLQEINTLQDRMQTETNQIQENTEQLEQNSSHIGGNEENEEAKARIEEKYQEKIKEKDTKIQKMETLIEKFKDSNILHLNKKDKEIQDLCSENHQLTQQFSEYKQEISELKLQLSYYEKLEKNQEIDIKSFNSSQITILEDRNKELSLIIQNVEQRCTDLQQKITEYEKQYKTKSDKLSHIQKKYKQVKQAMKYLKEELAQTYNESIPLVSFILLNLLEKNEISPEIPIKLLIQKAIKTLKNKISPKNPEIPHQIENALNTYVFCQYQDLNITSKIQLTMLKWRSLLYLPSLSEEGRSNQEKYQKLSPLQKDTTSSPFYPDNLNKSTFVTTLNTQADIENIIDINPFPNHLQSFSDKKKPQNNQQDKLPISFSKNKNKIQQNQSNFDIQDQENNQNLANFTQNQLEQFMSSKPKKSEFEEINLPEPETVKVEFMKNSAKIEEIHDDVINHAQNFEIDQQINKSTFNYSNSINNNNSQFSSLLKQKQSQNSMNSMNQINLNQFSSQNSQQNSIIDKLDKGLSHSRSHSSLNRSGIQQQQKGEGSALEKQFQQNLNSIKFNSGSFGINPVTHKKCSQPIFSSNKIEQFSYKNGGGSSLLNSNCSTQNAQNNIQTYRQTSYLSNNNNNQNHKGNSFLKIGSHRATSNNNYNNNVGSDLGSGYRSPSISLGIRGGISVCGNNNLEQKINHKML